jgi:hypothetical protein
MNRSMLSVCGAMAALCATANGAIVFSDVRIEGSLAAGATFDAGPDGISFQFPDAVVGDPVDPIRSGNIVITYNVEGTEGETFTEMLLMVAGELSGSGMIFINEIVEDLNGFGVLGSLNALLTDNSQLPYTDVFPFEHASNKIRVKKTLVLAAVDTQAFDLAELTQVDQIPTPGSVTLLAGAGAVCLVYRRRR